MQANLVLCGTLPSILLKKESYFPNMFERYPRLVLQFSGVVQDTEAFNRVEHSYAWQSEAESVPRAKKSFLIISFGFSTLLSQHSSLLAPERLPILAVQPSPQDQSWQLFIFSASAKGNSMARAMASLEGRTHAADVQCRRLISRQWLCCRKATPRLRPGYALHCKSAVRVPLKGSVPQIPLRAFKIMSRGKRLTPTCSMASSREDIEEQDSV